MKEGGQERGKGMKEGRGKERGTEGRKERGRGSEERKEGWKEEGRRETGRYSIAMRRL
jgi:hypothetical protein